MAKERKTFLIQRGTTLGGSAALMADAVQWGDLLFLSGRAAVDPGTGKVRGDDFETQARVVLDDIFAALAAAGSKPAQVLRVECWLADAADFATWNNLFVSMFPEPRPARTTLVAAFPLPDLLIEVQVTAGVSS